MAISLMAVVWATRTVGSNPTFSTKPSRLKWCRWPAKGEELTPLLAKLKAKKPGRRIYSRS